MLTSAESTLFASLSAALLNLHSRPYHLRCPPTLSLPAGLNEVSNLATSHRIRIQDMDQIETSPKHPFAWPTLHSLPSYEESRLYSSLRPIDPQHHNQGSLCKPSHAGRPPIPPTRHHLDNYRAKTPRPPSCPTYDLLHPPPSLLSTQEPEQIDSGDRARHGGSLALGNKGTPALMESADDNGCCCGHARKADTSSACPRCTDEKSEALDPAPPASYIVLSTCSEMYLSLDFFKWQRFRSRCSNFPTSRGVDVCRQQWSTIL